MRLTFIPLVLALLSCLFFSTPASAQSGIHVEESKKHFQMGVELFKKEKYREALDEFMKSYDLRPHWGLLYNIGICYLKLDNMGKSLMTLLKFIEKGGSEISPAKASEVENFIQDMMGKVGLIRFNGDLSNSKVLVDGEHYPEAGENMYLYLDPGKRYIRIEKYGSIIFEDKVTIKKGKELIIDIETTGESSVKPVEIGTMPVVPPVTPPVVPKGPEEKKDRSRSLKFAGIAFAAIAGALLIGYAAAGGIAISEKNKMRDVEEAYKKKWDEETATQDDYNAAMADQDVHYDNANNAKLAANVLFGLGVASAAAAIGLLVGAKLSKGKAETKPAPALGLSYDGLSLSLSF